MPTYELKQPPSSLIGEIFTATVISRHVDSCDFRLDNGERVRLYQHDSHADTDVRLMKDISQYSERKKCRFMITHRRMDGKNTLYYANERWAENNPWKDLPLQYGDRVQGKVIRSVHSEQNILKGYLIQLDPTVYLNQNPNNPFQPDIPIYIPLDTLPWADGSIGHTPPQDGFQHLLLESNDQVQATITEIHRLPRYPVASVIRSIQHQNVSFWSDAYTTARGASIKERLHIRHISQATGIDTEDEYALLKGCRILLVDDREDSLYRLQQILNSNGAQTQTIQYTPSLHPDDLVQILKARIQEFQPNLILIDNALPQPNDGLRLAQQLFVQAEEVSPPPCALVSSLFLPEDIQYIRQQAPFLRGALMRPLLPQQIIDLYEGKVVWSESIQFLDTHPNLPQQQNIHIYCMRLVQDKVIDSVTIIALEQGQLRWEYGAGITPFPTSDLAKTIQESDLHLLMEQRVESTTLQRGDHADTRLLGSQLAEYHWFSVISHDGSLARLVGLGWKSTEHPTLARTLRDGIREKYANLELHAWVKHNANFISSGIAAHSLVHEYRNYLHQLLAGLDTLEKGLSNQTTETLTNITTKLREETVLPMETLADVLLKGQAQRTEPASVSDLLDTLSIMLKPYAKECGVHFRIINNPKLTLGIDSANISIPLSNLVSNAIKHHTSHQECKVSLLTQILHDNGNFWLEFQVRDNGNGIPTHQVGRLFQPGISFARQTSERHGIGLWLARSLARKVGGDITLTQNLRGMGTCFTLRIPLTLG